MGSYCTSGVMYFPKPMEKDNATIMRVCNEVFIVYSHIYNRCHDGTCMLSRILPGPKIVHVYI